MYVGICLRKYYTSIKELPIANWIEVYENDDYRPLLKKGKLDRFGQIAYDKISDQIIDTFGISSDYLKTFKLQVKIEELYAKQFKTGDRSNQLVIDLLESELEGIKNQPNSHDLFDSIASIEKFMQLRINSKELTVYEFYKYSKYVSKSLKAA